MEGQVAAVLHGLGRRKSSGCHSPCDCLGSHPQEPVS